MKFRQVLAVGLLAVFVGCGGGGGGSKAPDPGPTQDPSGIWTGTFTLSGSSSQTLIAASTPGGSIRFWVEDGSLGVAQISVSGSTFTGSGTDYLPDGTTQTITFSNTSLTTKTSLVCQVDFNVGDHGTVSMSYDPLYGRPVTVSALAGTFHADGSKTSSGSTADLTISASGAIAGSSGAGAFTGTITQIDTAKNLFNVSINYSGDSTTYTGYGFWSDGQSAKFDADTLYVQLSGGGSGFAAAVAKVLPGSVDIVNNCGDSLTDVYIVPSSTADWGSNLATSPIANGSSALYSGFAPGTYNCKVITLGGLSGEYDGFTVTSGETFTITWNSSAAASALRAVPAIRKRP